MPRNKTMSEFPEIQPFGPRPAPHSGDPQAKEAESVAQPVPPTPGAAPVVKETAERGTNVNLGLILTVGVVGFALGYVLARYQEVLIRESKIDDLIESTRAWIRDQGPKIADPIRQGLESAESTWDQAVKKVRSNRPSGVLSFFQR
jgi:hypothetical protein